MKNFFKVIILVLSFLLLTNNALACSIAIPTISIDSVTPAAKLDALVGECLDTDCKFTLIKDDYYTDKGTYIIALNGDSERGIASVSTRFNTIDIYNSINKDEVLGLGVTSLFEALDKVTTYDLTEDQNAIESLIEEYLTSSSDSLFEEFHFDIKSNEKLTASKEESIKSSNNSKSCYDKTIEEYSDFHTFSSRDKGICIVDEGDGASCPSYIYPELGLQTVFSDRSAVLFMGVIMACICLGGVGVLATIFVFLKKNKPILR